MEGVVHWRLVVVALLAIGLIHTTPTTYALSLHGCAPTVTTTQLPHGCWLGEQWSNEEEEDGYEARKTSFKRAVCSMERCTTDRGSCADEDGMCCCRAQKTDNLSIFCPDNSPDMLVDPRTRKNESQCACSPCDDVIIKVRLRVKGQGDDGPIPAAQIFNLDTEEIIGLTMYSGILDFDVAYRTRKLRLLLQATGYQRVTRVYTLSPRHPSVTLNVTMTRTVVANVGSGDSEIVFPVGKSVWIYASPGAFHKNGMTHENNVIFKGSYVDSESAEVLDLIDSERFVVEDGQRFALVAAVFLEFEDEEGEPLDVRDLRLTLPLDGEEEEEEYEMEDMFTAVHDWETGKWTRLSSFSRVESPRGKRATISNVLCEAPDITVAQLIAIATSVGADCWAQIRTFDQSLNPFPGALVTLIQRRVVAGFEVVYRIGTDTGGAQTANESLATNAICLPLDCNDFFEASISARFEPNSPLVPVEFPTDTFVGAPSEPLIEDNEFVFSPLEPFEIASGARPVYIFVSNCIREAQESNAVADRSEFFSFATDYIPFEPDTDQCYVKVTVWNCLFRANIPMVATRDAQTGDITSTQVFPQYLLPVPSVGSGFPEECLEYNVSCPSMCAEPQPICLPFRCGDIVQIMVHSNLTTTGEISSCESTSISPVLSDSVLAFRGDIFEELLTIDSSVLDPDSFNDPELGLYYDPQPTRARQLCNGGGTLRSSPVREGSAAEFGCFTDDP